MEVKENVQLSSLTTLQIGGEAKYMIDATSTEEIMEALSFAREKELAVFIMGGGSNILFSDDGFDGVIIRPIIKGLEIIEESDEHALVKVGAGEVLDDLVAFTVEKGLWGIENLSFVPGLVGALVIQNVNAYGAKAEHVVESVNAIDRGTSKERKFTNKECDFTYRHSIFNTTDKDRYIVTTVVLKLSKNGKPNLSYVDLENYFRDNPNPTQGEVREAVTGIRKNKGQDWNELPSAGSFFSNFLIDKREFGEVLGRVEKNFGEEKREELEEIGKRFFDSDEGGKIKIPSAWVLDKLLNLKGFTIGNAMHSNYHALNLVNKGGASASDMMNLFQHARQLVYEKTGLELINEPELVGFSESEIREYFSIK